MMSRLLARHIDGELMSSTEHARRLLFLAALWGMGCGDSQGRPVDGGSGADVGPPPPQLTIDIDLAKAGAAEAATWFRPGVVAYGLLQADRPNGYFGLQQFLAATGSRAGYVKIDELGVELRKLTDVKDLPAALAQLDEPIKRVIDGGGRAELNLLCMLPAMLSKFDGYNHDILSGNDTPSGQPIFACGPLKDRPKGASAPDPTVKQNVRQAWHDMMQATAQFFAKYGDKILYLVGNEPESYFAGDEQEFFELFEVTVRGLRAGDPKARVAGIATAFEMDTLLHTNPRYDATSNTFSFSDKVLPVPMVQLWLEYLDQQKLPIDVVQIKKFGANPLPADSAFWVAAHQKLDAWLKAYPGAHAANVELFYSDFPGWHTVCAEDQQGHRESIWDSEYFAAWFTSAYIGIKSYAQRQSGIVTNIEPLLAFLVEFGISAFFQPSCEADESRPAGFGGAIGLVTTRTGLPKPILHSLRFLSGLEGKLVSVDQTDPNLQIVGAVTADRVSVLVSYFVPSELSYHPAGFQGYEFGTLFRNDYGSSRDTVSLKSLEPSALAKSYFAAPDFPKSFVHDLLAEPQKLDIAALGLPQAYNDFVTAARTAGRRHRQIRAQSAAGQHQRATLRFSALGDAQYTLRAQVIDATHGNPYAERYDLHKRLTDALDSGGEAAAGKLLEQMREDYGPASTVLFERPYDNGAGVTLDIKPNSVHLLVLTAK